MHRVSRSVSGFILEYVLRTYLIANSSDGQGAHQHINSLPTCNFGPVAYGLGYVQLTLGNKIL